MDSARPVREPVRHAHQIREQPYDREPHLGALKPRLAARTPTALARGTETESGAVPPPPQRPRQLFLGPRPHLGRPMPTAPSREPQGMGHVQHVAGVLRLYREPALIAAMGQYGVHDPLRVRHIEPELGVGAPGEPVVAVDQLQPARGGRPGGAPHPRPRVHPCGEPAEQRLQRARLPVLDAELQIALGAGRPAVHPRAAWTRSASATAATPAARAAVPPSYGVPRARVGRGGSPAGPGRSPRPARGTRRCRHRSSRRRPGWKHPGPPSGPHSGTSPLPGS